MQLTSTDSHFVLELVSVGSKSFDTSLKMQLELLRMPMNSSVIHKSYFFRAEYRDSSE